ncbi:MAG: SDR family oxidoreductase [Candidatus Omnitrophica bacterium]|nr:SDR family oxidoreductase [Candidatus Omnitrophota bacterium]
MNANDAIAISLSFKKVIFGIKPTNWHVMNNIPPLIISTCLNEYQTIRSWNPLRTQTSMKLSGKIVLITGGARRVGRHIALDLAKQGAHIAMTYQTSEREANQTVSAIRKIGVRAAAFYTNVSWEADVQSTVHQVLQKFKRIDVLINNAANFLRVPFSQLTGKDFDDSINVNLKGPYLFCGAVGKVMLKQKRGKIINMADWAGLRPYKNYIPYCVSKGGVITLTKALAKSLAPYVQVNAILPGAILLPKGFNRKERETIIRETPLKKIGSPDDIAQAVQFLIEGSDFITGVLLPVDGGRLIT